MNSWTIRIIDGLMVATIVISVVLLAVVLFPKPKPEPFVRQTCAEDDPCFCVGKPFPCGVWPEGTPNHEAPKVRS